MIFLRVYNGWCFARQDYKLAIDFRNLDELKRYVIKSAQKSWKTNSHNLDFAIVNYKIGFYQYGA